MDWKKHIISMLDKADIQINGKRTWDIQIHNEEVYDRFVKQGTLGLGEAYVEGWWDCAELDVMFCKALRTGVEKFTLFSYPTWLLYANHKLFNIQNPRKSLEVAESHYNNSNQLFEAMLGENMNYSCAYWKEAETLDEAQEAKMELICQKLQLEEGMKILDIGSGWGALAAYLAKNYGVTVTAITNSNEQFKYSKEKYPGLSIDWRLEDYNYHRGKYDRIVSVGMFEHVGKRNYCRFFNIMRRLLNPDGLFLLHTIGSNQNKLGVEAWVNKYIFPNGNLPSMLDLSCALHKKFVMEDWHNFGADYDKTLMTWDKRFYDAYLEKKFECDEHKRRMFHFYLCSCAGAFRARDLQLWQIVLSPDGVLGGYCCR